MALVECVADNSVALGECVADNSVARALVGRSGNSMCILGTNREITESKRKENCFEMSKENETVQGGNQH